MHIRSYKNQAPKIHPQAFVDPQAHVSGDVELAEGVSVWPMAVLRGDVQAIRVGANSNIQDGAVLHVTHDSHYQPGGIPLIIGQSVTVGHNATLHACTLDDLCLVGMGSIVLDGATIETEVMVGAGALVPPGKTLERGFLYVGSPVKQHRPLSDNERKFLRHSANHYIEVARNTAAMIES